jgi:hypothetical protein
MMTIGKKAAAVLVLGTALSGAAFAFQDAPVATSTLSTAPLVPNGTSQLDCYIINVSKKPRWVGIEALDKQGNVVASWTETLEPSKEAVAISPAADGPRSCRFAVEGTGKDFRASGLVVLPGVGSISALQAE